MADNNLTPAQDLSFRAMFKMVLNNPNILKESPAHRRQLLAICLEALNYRQLPNGRYVQRDLDVKVAFGSNDYNAYPDEWEADKERSHEAINNKGNAEASTSSTPSDTSVRKTVLSEDV